MSRRTNLDFELANERFQDRINKSCTFYKYDPDFTPPEDDEFDEDTMDFEDERWYGDEEDNYDMFYY
jgi:hypothetical protein